MEKKEVPRVAVYIDLPVPSEEVIYAYIEKTDKADMVVDKYLQTVQKIAEIEADAIFKTTKAKYSFYWKIIAIICAFVFLITGMFLGYKLKPYFERAGLECTPTQQVNK